MRFGNQVLNHTGHASLIGLEGDSPCLLYGFIGKKEVSGLTGGLFYWLFGMMRFHCA